MHSIEKRIKAAQTGCAHDTMGGAPGSQQYASMIIRLQQVPEGVTGTLDVSWRSEVEHLQSGEYWEFFSLAELEQFLQDFLRQLEGKP